MQVFVKQFHSQQTLLRVFLYRLQQCDKAFPQGEDAERSEADEGVVRSIFPIFGQTVLFPLISQKSKIFASFPQGKL